MAPTHRGGQGPPGQGSEGAAEGSWAWAGEAPRTPAGSGRGPSLMSKQRWITSPLVPSRELTLAQRDI